MSLIIEIKVVPLSGKQKLFVDKSGILKCFIKSAPEKGKANKEVIDIISSVCGVTKKSVEIISGLTVSKKKLIIDTNMTIDNFLIKIGVGRQKTIFIDDYSVLP